MAASTQYGANYAAARDAGPATLLRHAQWGGKVRNQRDVATLSSDSDIGSLIYVGKLRKGTLPLRVIIKGATTKAVTGTIGWAGSSAALGTFTTLATGGPQILFPTSPNTVLTEDKDIYITTAGANADAGDVIVTDIEYATAD